MESILYKMQHELTSLARKTAFISGLLLIAGVAPQAVYAQEAEKLTVGRILGINFLPNYIMEAQGSVEKHARELGVPNFKVEWKTFSGGGGATDALLAGAVDVANAGASNLLLLWDRTRGGVKGIVSNAALPAVIVTTDPKLKTLKDYGPTDKIAVPTVGVSTQAILLQMQVAKTFGPDQWKRMDVNTVQMGHSDAMAALSNPKHEVKSHFASPPFIARELKSVPGAHVVITSSDIIGSSVSTAVLFTTTKFASANPKIMQAIRLASEDAIILIHANPRQAAEIYLKLTNDRTPLEEMTTIIRQADMKYAIAPEGTMKIAEHLFRIGVLKTKPKAWTDYFLPVAADLSGS